LPQLQRLVGNVSVNAVVLGWLAQPVGTPASANAPGVLQLWVHGVKDQAVDVKVWGELKHALVGLRPGAVVLVVTVRRGKSSTRLARRLELAVVV
jgi:hypothetical protein